MPTAGHMYGSVTKAVALLQPQQLGLSRVLLILEGTISPHPERHGAHGAGVNGCQGLARFLWAVVGQCGLEQLFQPSGVSQGCLRPQAKRGVGRPLAQAAAGSLLLMWCVLSSAARHGMVLGWGGGSEPYTAGAMRP